MKDFYGNNLNIQIYDDLFDYSWKMILWDKIIQYNYRLGWNDTPDYNYSSNKLIHCELTTKKEVDDIGFINQLVKTNKFNQYANKKINKIVLNMSFPSDYYQVHTHPQMMVFLYYINLEWKPHWSGETLFFNESGEEIIFASIYKPGRLIMFDGDIPHTFRPQSFNAPNHRYSLSLFIEK